MRACSLYPLVSLVLPGFIYSPSSNAQDFIDSVIDGLVEDNIDPLCA